MLKDTFNNNIHIITREMVDKIDNTLYEIYIYIEYLMEDDKGYNGIIMANINEKDITFWHNFYCMFAEKYKRNMIENLI